MSPSSTHVEPSMPPPVQSMTSRSPRGWQARGIGLIGGIELVADKASRAQHATPIAPRVVALALERGLIVRALAGDVVAVCPPLVVSLDEIDEIFDLLEAALDDTLAAGVL